LVKSAGVELLAKVSGPPDLLDYVRAAGTKSRYADILPPDDVLITWGAADICKKLSSYTNIPLNQLDKHFASNKIISFTDNIGELIKNDIHTLAKLAPVPGGRHTIARKLEALFYLAKYQASAKIVDAGRKHKDNPYLGKMEAHMEQFKTIVKTELGIDCANIPESFPLKIARCDTMGHHQDVFHPSVESSSYYLEGDYCGGSAEIMIINKSLLTPEELTQWTPQAMEQALGDQLNSGLAPWTRHPGIIYMSDMAAYLIRVSGCFEGREMRFRVDPTKLWNIIGCVCKS